MLLASSAARHTYPCGQVCLLWQVTWPRHASSPAAPPHWSVLGGTCKVFSSHIAASRTHITRNVGHGRQQGLLQHSAAGGSAHAPGVHLLAYEQQSHMTFAQFAPATSRSPPAVSERTASHSMPQRKRAVPCSAVHQCHSPLYWPVPSPTTLSTSALQLLQGCSGGCDIYPCCARSWLSAQIIGLVASSHVQHTCAAV
jgi:hypothetical protein